MDGTSTVLKPISDWGRPGFTSGDSHSRNVLRLFWQLFRQPEGHRTRPTKAGILLISLAIAIGAAAFNTAQNILYLGLALLLGSLIVSGLLSWWNFYGCRWRLKVERHGRVGEALPLTIEVANDKRWLPSYGLAVEAADASDALKAKAYFGGRLPASGRVQTERLVYPIARGRLDLRIASLGSGYPFGFLNKSICDTAACSSVIWAPRVDYTLNRVSGGRTRRQGATVVRKGSGSELAGMRHYRPGDPQRSIHWKLSARAGRLMVRETLKESSLQIALVVDTAGDQWTPEAVDSLAALVSTLAEDLYMDQKLSGVLINGEEVFQVRRLLDLHALLDELALLQPVSHVGSGSISNHATAFTFAPSGDGVRILHQGEVVGGT